MKLNIHLGPGPRARSLFYASLLFVTACSGSKGGKPVDTADTATDAGQPFDLGGASGDVAAPDLGAPDLDPPKDVSSSPDLASTDMALDMTEPPPPPVEVTWPATPDEYATTAQVTYIATLRFPDIDANDQPMCCRDFGDVSRNPGIDNSFAILASSLLGLGFDLNELLYNTVASGDLVALLDHRELDGQTDPDGFVLAWLRGSFEAPTDYASASAGTGTFRLDPDSLEATGEPKLMFNPSQMQAGAMTAGPAALNLLLPIALQTLDVTVDEASMSGNATIGGNGLAYTDGTMSGWVELKSIFDNLNLLVANECACLGLGDTPLFEQQPDGSWTGNCIQDPKALCTEELCSTLAGSDINDGGACALTRQLLPQLADIDLDGDRSKFEAISIGLEWTGVEGQVVGVQ